MIQYNPFFAMSVPSLTRRPTTVKTWVVTDLQQILTSSFITIYIFAIVVPYFVAVCFLHPLKWWLPRPSDWYNDVFHYYNSP